MNRLLPFCLLLTACRRPPAPPPPEVRPLTDFERYAERLRNSENPYYGTLQIARLQRELSSFQAHALLGREYLRFAEVDRSLEHLEKALAIAPGPKDRAFLLEQLAVAHLKQAELDNCVAMHGPESCLLPLSEEALHRNPRGSEAAIRRLLECLEIDPENLRARWLLTFAHLTLGRTPPERHAVPIPKPEVELPRFRNIAPETGLTTVNHAGGAVMDDFNGDGRIDFITTDCAPDGPMHFWHQEADGRFVDRPIPGQLGGLNLTHADYDNDGDFDLLVLRGGWMKEDGHLRVSLLRNHVGRFEDVTVEAGLADPAFPTQTAAWADMDLDGDLDLFIGSEGYPCRLFRNNDGRFVNVAKEAGVENGGYTKGCAWGDFDDDGDPDLYVSNFGQANRLYRNDGGRFRDVAAELGIAEPLHSFACWFFDYNNDGRLDLFVAGYSRELDLVVADMLGRESAGERPRLYRNLGGKFEDGTRNAGLWRVWQPMGANFGDLDQDGFLDVYLGTGFPAFDSIVPNIMLRNSGTRFQLVEGFGHLQKGHGVAWGDYDGDGDEDVFIEIGGFYPGDGFRNALFRNPGFGRNWITVRLIGTKSNRFGVGTRITVKTGTRSIYRCVGTGGSFGGNTHQEEIGLGDETPKSLEIRWPSGKRQTIDDVPSRGVVEVRE